MRNTKINFPLKLTETVTIRILARIQEKSILIFLWSSLSELIENLHFSVDVSVCILIKIICEDLLQVQKDNDYKGKLSMACSFCNSHTFDCFTINAKYKLEIRKYTNSKYLNIIKVLIYEENAYLNKKWCLPKVKHCIRK